MQLLQAAARNNSILNRSTPVVASFLNKRKAKLYGARFWGARLSTIVCLPPCLLLLPGRALKILAV